jgi:hypothetical protein
MSATNISGPWRLVSQIDVQGGPSGAYEDPFLYTDKRNNFHVIYHVYNTTENPPHGPECVNSTVSAHVFSEDGHTWHAHLSQPYTTQVHLSSRGTITVATRERPKISFLTLMAPPRSSTLLSVAPAHALRGRPQAASIASTPIWTTRSPQRLGEVEGGGRDRAAP